MKIRGKKIYSFILVLAFSISLAGCALTQTDKIKKNVWKNMNEGAKVYLKSSWQKGDIKPADAKFNPADPNYHIFSNSDIEKLLAENKLYIVNFNGENPNKPGYEVTVFADVEGNIVGYDNTYRNSLPVEGPK